MLDLANPAPAKKNTPRLLGEGLGVRSHKNTPHLLGEGSHRLFLKGVRSNDELFYNVIEAVD